MSVYLFTLRGKHGFILIKPLTHKNHTNLKKQFDYHTIYDLKRLLSKNKSFYFNNIKYKQG